MAFAVQQPPGQAGSNRQRAVACRKQSCTQLQFMTAFRQQQRQQQQHHVCRAAANLRPLEVSSSIAAARAGESSRPDALFQDPYAAALCGQQASSSSSMQAAMDVVATQYIDESLQNAMDAHNVNSIQEGDYR